MLDGWDWGLTLEDAKAFLAELQRRVVQTQIDEPVNRAGFAGAFWLECYAAKGTSSRAA